MEFCPQNISLSVVWIDQGFNPCFFETISVSICDGFLISFFLVHWLIHAWKSSPTSPENRPRSLAFNLQVIFTIMMPLMATFQFFLRGYVIGKNLNGISLWLCNTHHYKLKEEIKLIKALRKVLLIQILIYITLYSI